MSTRVELSAVDPHDEAAFASFHGVVEAVARHDRPGETGHTLRELHVEALRGTPAPDGTPPVEERTSILLARSAGRSVGAVQVDLPLLDNTHVALFRLGVLPEERRRGVGRVLLEAALEQARAAGRTTVMTDVDEPPALLGRSPGRRFALAHGFTGALLEVRRDLELPIPAERLDRLTATAEQRSGGYEVLTLADRWPDEHAADRAELGRRMSVDVPLGDLAWQEERWDVDRVRRNEQQLREQGRRLLAAAAVHVASGRVVAFTEVVVTLEHQERVWQADTLVLPEHRGRSLGLLVKAALARRLQREHPQARRVLTFNAEDNRWMIAVNEALGFRVNGGLVSFQRVL